MRQFGKWSVGLGTLAFMALPLLAAGCAEEPTSTPATDAPAAAPGDMPADDLGEPEAGSLR